MRVIVAGAAGRMGRMLVATVAEAADAELVGATERKRHAALGEDAGELAGVGRLGVPVVDELGKCPPADVVIDFTAPEATLLHARTAAARGMRMVIGTTGFSEEQRRELEATLAPIGAVIAANFALGVNLMLVLAEIAAKALGEGFDAEIVEAHHRHKVDAPSGTALALGEAIAKARGASLKDKAVFARQGLAGPRKAGEIGFAVVRAGAIVGEHRAIFAGESEIVEIRHEALSRRVFADGALAAARWLMQQPAGVYSMRDVLGLGKLLGDRLG